MALTRKCFVGLVQCALIVAALSSASSAQLTIATVDARRQSFNGGWRFYKGSGDGAEQPQFDDSKWRTIRLPHDWAIEGPCDHKISPHIGALPSFGTGWYRKTFVLPPSAKGKYFAVEFGGAMSNSQVWLNGHLLGGRPYGYSGFQLDMTPYLNFGADNNVLAVRLTPEEHSSRWYPGAGSTATFGSTSRVRCTWHIGGLT
jgi:beta-galactosidase